MKWNLIMLQESNRYAHGKRKDHERMLGISAAQQGRMADFSAFIASKSFDLWNLHVPQIK